MEIKDHFIDEHVARLFLEFKRWLDIADCLDGSFDPYEGKKSESILKVEKAFNAIYPEYKFEYAIHNYNCDDCSCDFGKWCVMMITDIASNTKFEREYKWASYRAIGDDYLHKLIGNK